MSDHLNADLSRHRFGDDFERALYHVGDPTAPLAGWRRLIQDASALGWREVRKHADAVMRLVAEPRVLYTAAAALRSAGPKAPGPNGLTLHDLDVDELWGMCTALGAAIAAGTYRPGRERVVWVTKISGVRKRPIVLTDVQDRVAQKAADAVLRTVLDMRFDPCSFAFRTGRTREQGIAVAEQIAADGRPVLLAHDLRDAFGRVPLQRLLDVVERLLPCPRLRAFLGRVLPPKSRVLGGLKQGGPLSPTVLEVYLTHFLHEPWRQRAGHPTPLLRYADDLLLAAPDAATAKAADAALRKLLTPAGMELKADFEDAVTDIRAKPAEWLGFKFRLAGGAFRVQLGTNAFTKLGKRFVVAHAKSRPAERAARVVEHWGGQLGPAHRWEDRPAVLRRVADTARVFGFEEFATAERLEELWAEAADRWEATRRAVRSDPGYLAAGPLAVPTPTSVVW